MIYSFLNYVMIQRCTICDCSVANLFIPTYGAGNHNSVIAWVSSYAPTRTEQKKGVYSLDKYLPLTQEFIPFGFNVSNSYFTHIIKCRMTRAPSELEVVNCVPNLSAELNKLPHLKIIVLIGNTAFKAFTGMTISDNVNKPIYGKYILIGIPHPNFIVANNLKYDLSIVKYLHNIIVHR